MSAAWTLHEPHLGRLDQVAAPLTDRVTPPRRRNVYVGARHARPRSARRSSSRVDRPIGRLRKRHRRSRARILPHTNFRERRAKGSDTPPLDFVESSTFVGSAGLEQCGHRQDKPRLIDRQSLVNHSNKHYLPRSTPHMCTAVRRPKDEVRMPASARKEARPLYYSEHTIAFRESIVLPSPAS